MWKLFVLELEVSHHIKNSEYVMTNCSIYYEVLQYCIV
jgi:hypothetical protein